jgi:iron(III) transport system permease protein
MLRAGDAIDTQSGRTAEPVVRRPGIRPYRPGGPPLALLAPSLLVAALVALPILYLIYRASQADERVWDLVYRQRTFDILVNTVVLAITVSVTAAAVAVPLAWLTLRTDLPLARFVAPISALPLVIPSYVGAFAFIAALGPRGYVSDQLDRWLGIDQIPSIYGFFGAWLTLSLFTFPYVYINVSAALQGIDPAMEDAARGLGQGPIIAFLTTTLPMLRPAIISGMLLSALYVVSDFGVVTLFRFDSLTRAIYVQYRSSFDRSMAAVLALILVILAVFVLVMEAWLRGRSSYHRVSPGLARRQRRTKLGRWRWPAFGFVGLVLASSFVLPIAVLAAWLTRAIRRGDEFSGLGEAAWNTIWLGAVAAIVTTAFAIPVAILATRYRSAAGSLVERMTYLGYGLPGIVIALSFVFIGANYLPRFYQTVPLLLVAYMIRFVPQAIGACRTSLLQISPRLEEAARNLGRSPSGAIRSVTIPLAWPGITAGGALVFLTVAKELPITLLLRPTGMDTLVTEVWTATGTGAFGRAAAPALLLIAISAVPAALVLSRARGQQLRGDA